MKTTEPTGERIAFFVPHPDDIEVLLGFTVLQTAQQKPTPALYAYVATDGEASTVGDPQFVKGGLRRQETGLGLATLGIIKSRIHQPGLPDGQLHTPAVYEKLVQDIRDFIEANDITTAFTLGTHGVDGHTDHIAVHQAVVESSPHVMTYGLAPGGNGYRSIGTIAQTKRKFQAIAANHSQFPMHPAEASDLLPPGWHYESGMAIPPTTYAYLENYRSYLAMESFELIKPQSDRIRYTKS